MNRLFLRLYLALAVAVLSALALAWTMDRLGRSDIPVAPSQWAEVESAVHEAFGRAAPGVAEQAVTSRFRVHLTVLPEDAPAVRPEPMLGYWFPPPPYREVRVAGGPRVAIQWERPPPRIGTPVVALLALIAASVALFTWLRSLDAGLKDLTEVAARLGARDRVRALEDPRQPTHTLARTFNEMADRIDSLLRAQEELMAGVSHELRTPLMRLQFAVEMLPAVRDAEAQQRHIADIHKDIGELDALIGELLTFARTRGGEDLVWDVHDTGDLFAEIADETRRLAPDRPVVIAAHGVAVRGDRRLLLRALRNLTENAVRHGAGTITLAAEAGAGQVALVVSDEGPGIPEAEREHVLQPFVRLGDTARTGGGLGLGLALVDHIARQHGGNVQIGSAPGGGARVALAALTRADRG